MSIVILQRCLQYRCSAEVYGPIIWKRMLSRLTYDMVIIGGGMVGCALTACAGNSKYFNGKSILLIDSAKPNVWENRAPSEFDIRVSAISPASVIMLKELDVWNIINEIRCPQRVKQLRVWDACSSSSIHFEHPNMDENVAYIVENTALLTAFWRRIQQLKNVETAMDCGTVRRCQLSIDDDHLASLELENGTTVKAKLLVGADGFKSVIRKAMNVHELNWNYEQKGIVGTLQLPESENENNVAWQRFTPTGPIALLPLDRTTSSLVWTTTVSEADRLLSLKPEEFIEELNHALFTRSNETVLVNQLSRVSYLPAFSEDYVQFPPRITALRSRVAAFPLGFQHASNYVARGVALVGDAAHRVHPLAGQGVNLGFGDVVTLVDELEQAISRGEEIGALSALRAYESRRQWHNLSVMMTVDGLNRLYATSSPPVVLIRSLGLNLVNRCTPLKDFFMKRAST